MRQRKFKELFLQTQVEQKILLELVQKGQNEVSKHSSSQNSVWNAIDNFIYALKEDNLRYKDSYNTDSANWVDFKNVHLLLSKLGMVEYTKFGNYKKTSDLTFSDAVELLSELFSPKTSLFHKRWKCMNLTRKKQQRLYNIHKCRQQAL